MIGQILFQEVQKFKQIWIWLLLVIANFFIIYTFVAQVLLNQPIGQHPARNIHIVIILVLSLSSLFLYYSLKLETIITEQGISVRFLPLIIKYKNYPFSQISKCYIRKYRPIFEYGGWGIRLGGLGRGKAYNISGNIGLQIEFKDGKKLLIGTQKQNELQLVLSRFSQFSQM